MTATGAVAAGPSTRDEAWRYTPVDEILARVERSATANPGARVTRADLDALAGDRFGPRLVFVNGHFRADLSDLLDLPGGLWCGRIGSDHAATTQPAAAHDIWPSDGLLPASAADVGDIAGVIADGAARLDAPVHVVHVAAPDHVDGDTSSISHPRTIIDVGAGGRIAVVETYCGLAGATVTNAATVIHVGDGAALDHCRVQVEAAAATHVGHTRVEQGSDSRLRAASITVGGDLARNAIDVHLGAPDAVAELSGLDLAARSQRHDTVVTVDHAASHCSSDQRFAGVVDDHGRGSFSGEIIVRPGTVDTDANQSNRNLVLTPDAEADTRPWLQILADDVRCTHGATVGRLDDEALFYLRSRGVPLARARTMLIDAFIGGITDTITHDVVRAHVAALLLPGGAPAAGERP